MSLTKRETEFCRLYAICKNSREAAARSGFAFPERSGIRLLSNPAVKEEISRLCKNNECNSSAVDGLRRIAFGSVVDGVKLILSDGPIDIEGLDLYMVSEIKRSANGATEVKFFDRIKALEALLGVKEDTTEEQTNRFVDAIFKGASAIKDVRSDQDEL